MRIGRWRFSALELLIALALLIVLAPFVQSLPNGRTIESGLMTLMLVFAVLAVGARTRTLLLSILLVTPAVAARWLHHFRPDIFPAAAHPAAALLFLAYTIFCLLDFVLRAPRVDAEVLCASISAYLMLGLFWALAYTLAAAADSHAFIFNTANAAGSAMEGFNAFYFSFVTLSTVGFGDITPVSPVARMLAVTEAVTGLLYVAVLIARLVALYSAPNSSTPSD